MRSSALSIPQESLTRSGDTPAALSSLVVHLSVRCARRVEAAGPCVRYMRLDGAELKMLHEVFRSLLPPFTPKLTTPQEPVRQVLFAKLVVYVALKVGIEHPSLSCRSTQGTSLQPWRSHSGAPISHAGSQARGLSKYALWGEGVQPKSLMS